jgi:hypothetical protein
LRRQDRLVVSVGMASRWGLLMPTKRRKIGPRRVGGRLNDRQRALLLTGLDRFGQPDDAGFESDDHARQMWQRYRAELLADRDFNVNDPGYRPWGFWKFEAALKRNNFGWRWPRGCRSEVESVYKHYADEAERAAIERDWQRCPAMAPKWFRPASQD